jgi:hypothetical protein
MNKSVNVAIVGGSGFWSETNHHPSLLEISTKLPVRLVAIVDKIDPHSVNYSNTLKIISKDRTSWINPCDYKNTDEIIKKLIDIYDVNLVIIASDPSTHFNYGMSCMKFGVNTICDKPIVSCSNSSTNISKAKDIKANFKKLENAFISAKNKSPTIMFHSILRRRSLDAFNVVAKELGAVAEKTNAGINNMSVIVNGGVYKFPAEFNIPGSHGYLDGIGSLAHSAYHYLDVISWFISTAPGRAKKIVPTLNYVFRIEDYLKSQSFQTVAKLIDTSTESLCIPNLSTAILGCELDVGFSFILKDKNDIDCGQISFLFNHVSFSPRTNVYKKGSGDHANRPGGGRMSAFVIDVHQDGLQTWQMTKNNIVFEENVINLLGRRHPMLKGESLIEKTYRNAYNTDVNMKDFLYIVVDNIINNRELINHPVIRSLSEERLTTELYGACYELIAREYNNLPKLITKGVYI